MKRIILILCMVCLAGLVSAEPADISGQMIFAITSDLENVSQWYSEAFMNLKKDVTDNASFNIQLQAAYKMTGKGDIKPFTVYFDDFYGKLNLGGWFGINPELLKLETNFGWYSEAATTYTIGNYAYENVSGADGGSMSTVGLKATILEGPSIKAWFNPAGVGVPDPILNPPRFGANLLVPIGPVNSSLWYYTNGPLDSRVGGSVGVNLAAGDFGVSGDVEAATFLEDTELGVYGAAVRVSYTKYIGLAANVMGNIDGLQKVGFEVDSTPFDWLGILSGVAFNLVTGEFDNAEIGAWVKVDAVKVRFGYIVTDTAAAMGSMYASAVPLDGGLWVKAYLSY